MQRVEARSSNATGRSKNPWSGRPGLCVDQQRLLRARAVLKRDSATRSFTFEGRKVQPFKAPNSQCLQAYTAWVGGRPGTIEHSASTGSVEWCLITAKGQGPGHFAPRKVVRVDANGSFAFASILIRQGALCQRAWVSSVTFPRRSMYGLKDGARADWRTDPGQARLPVCLVCESPHTDFGEFSQSEGHRPRKMLPGLERGTPDADLSNHGCFTFRCMRVTARQSYGLLPG